MPPLGEKRMCDGVVRVNTLPQSNAVDGRYRCLVQVLTIHIFRKKVKKIVN